VVSGVDEGYVASHPHHHLWTDGSVIHQRSRRLGIESRGSVIDDWSLIATVSPVNKT
jgi:hypothetical protein